MQQQIWWPLQRPLETLMLLISVMCLFVSICSVFVRVYGTWCFLNFLMFCLCADLFCPVTLWSFKCTSTKQFWSLWTHNGQTCRKKGQLRCAVGADDSIGPGNRGTPTFPPHPAECWHQNKQTEEISRGIESTNSCQPSLRYMTGSAVVRTTEQKWKGTDRHAPFRWQTAQPWEGVGQTAFYKEICLTPQKLAAETRQLAWRGVVISVLVIKYGSADTVSKLWEDPCVIFSCMTWDLMI